MSGQFVATVEPEVTTDDGSPEIADVFVSYADADGPWVRDHLLPDLRQAGLQYWDHTGFEVGVPVLNNMEQAVDRSRHTLLIITPAWLANETVECISLLAATADPAGRRRRVLPLLLRKCPLPKRISFLTYADFTDSGRYAAEMRRLLRALAARTAVQELFPLHNRQTRHSALDGLEALRDLTHNPDVLAPLVECKTVLKQTKRQIQIVGKLKDLHDHLHDIQVRCYGPMAQELKRFPDDDVAVENLRECELTLEDIVESLHGIVKDAEYLQNELCWIKRIDQARSSLQCALETRESKPLGVAAMSLRRDLNYLDRINSRLTEAARYLQFDELVTALAELLRQISQLDVDRAKLTQVEDGVDAIDRLAFSLKVLIKQHDAWQLVDTEIRRIEVEIEEAPNQLDVSWPILRDLADPLYDRGIEQWEEVLKNDADEIQAAIARRDPRKIMACFRRYRHRAVRRFHQVDKALLTLCDHLREVSGPLAAILRVI